MKKLAIFIALACLLLSMGITPVYANGIPSLPHAFYGSVTINRKPAPVETTVEARGDGIVTGIAGNPIITTTKGIYGTSNPLEPRLIVQGDIDEGATITFYVNGKNTGETYLFNSGETTQLDLSLTTEKAKPSPRPKVETNIFGIEGSFSISSDGEILETIVATSDDGHVTITIEAGTVALLDGEPLETLTASINPNPPEPPEGTYLIEAYYFGPDGVTFDPPIIITWSYDPETLPEDVDVVMVYCYEETEEWECLPCDVDIEKCCVTASVAHFTTFALIGEIRPPEEEEVLLPEKEEEEVPPPEEVITAPVPAAFSVSHLSIDQLEADPGEAVTIDVMVANTGGESGIYTVILKINGVKETEKTVTITAGSSQTVSFSVIKEKAGTYTATVDGLSASYTVAAPLPAAPSRVNWVLIGGVIGGAIIVGLATYFVLRRRVY